ncbi:MAG: ribosome small subunit-dependent GTPase A [candidate division Zixibacteria bacterium]|nr:ribosome small subunit-dependent GTPase A [candidate division Zixibacteria bacterium]
MANTVIEGIVTCGHGKQFIVFAGGVYYRCHLRKKVKFATDQTTPVAVGDDVMITVITPEEGVVEEVLPRRTVLSRPAIGRETSEQVLAANVDSLIIVTSVANPPLRTGLIDRFIIAAGTGNLTPAIVVNKADLGIGPEAREVIDVYRHLGYSLFVTSVVNGEGLDDLRGFLKDHRSLMSGHSGVGKSSLLNRLVPGISQRISAVSALTGKGRHTTSSMELFDLPDGGFVIDTPGLKVLGLWQVDRESLAAYYPEFEACRDRCRFTGCRHLAEPDCAVKEAVASGEITRLRYDNYRHIYETLSGPEWQ